MPQPSASPPHQLARSANSFLQLRIWLGIIGTALPFVLILGHAFLRAVLSGAPAWRGWDLQSSMSAYYYTDMRNVFIGALCAIGAFLWAYKGYDEKSARAGTLAGICAVGVGLFPIEAPHHPLNVIADFHVGFAALLYLTLAFFAIFVFPIGGARGKRHQLRNLLYRLCGCLIVACLALIVVSRTSFARARVGAYHPALWLESLATIAFGISWLIKGEKILRDSNPAA